MLPVCYAQNAGLVLFNISALQDVNVDNVSDMYDLSEAFHAMSLRHTCVLFILEQFEKICVKSGYTSSPSVLFLGPNVCVM